MPSCIRHKIGACETCDLYYVVVHNSWAYYGFDVSVWAANNDNRNRCQKSRPKQTDAVKCVHLYSMAIIITIVIISTLLTSTVPIINSSFFRKLCSHHSVCFRMCATCGAVERGRRSQGVQKYATLQA